MPRESISPAGPFPVTSPIRYPIASAIPVSAKGTHSSRSYRLMGRNSFTPVSSAVPGIALRNFNRRRLAALGLGDGPHQFRQIRGGSFRVNNTIRKSMVQAISFTQSMVPRAKTCLRGSSAAPAMTAAMASRSISTITLVYGSNLLARFPGYTRVWHLERTLWSFCSQIHESAKVRNNKVCGRFRRQHEGDAGEGAWEPRSQ